MDPHPPPPQYEPYYLHHHQPPPQPPQEYYYHHENEIRVPNIINKPTIHIPKHQRHINTLFVSGLPHDVIPREIHNLFRRRPGFDSSQLEFTPRANQVVAFVTFHNHQSAVMALEALDGVKFDPQTGSVLRIELARSNSRLKPKRGSGPYIVIDKRKKADNDDAEDTSSDDGDDQSDDRNQSNENRDSPNHINSAVNSEEKKVQHSDTTKKESTVKASQGDPRPCSTLFIANLGPNCSEDELKQALSEYSGFNGLKLRARGGMPVAFADFEEVEQASHAMEALQGSMLPSSDRGGMLIEFARSKMRKL